MIQKMNHINADYGERMMGNFFEGFTVEDYCSKEVFQRLGAYIGHGFYYRTNHVKVDRVVGYDEFWGFSVSNELYERMKQPETAYIFWFLILYRRIYSNQTLLFLDDCPDLVIGNAANLFPVDAYRGTDGKRYPITHEILRDYVMNDRLVYPRRRMISRGRRFGKIMRQAHDEAAKKYFGKDVEITISLKGYEIQEVAPS